MYASGNPEPMGTPQALASQGCVSEQVCPSW